MQEAMRVFSQLVMLGVKVQHICLKTHLALWFYCNITSRLITWEICWLHSTLCQPII